MRPIACHRLVAVGALLTGLLGAAGSVTATIAHVSESGLNVGRGYSSTLGHRAVLPTPVPELATVLLWAAGLAGLMLGVRRRQRPAARQGTSPGSHSSRASMVSAINTAPIDASAPSGCVDGTLTVDFAGFVLSLLPPSDRFDFDFLVTDAKGAITGDFHDVSLLDLPTGYIASWGVVGDDFDIFRLTLTAAAVPAPATLGLVLVSLAGLGMARRRTG